MSYILSPFGTLLAQKTYVVVYLKPEWGDLGNTADLLPVSSLCMAIKTPEVEAQAMPSLLNKLLERLITVEGGGFFEPIGDETVKEDLCTSSWSDVGTLDPN